MTAEEEEREDAILWRFAVGYVVGFSVGLSLGLAFVLPIGFYIIWDIVAPVVLGFGVGFSLGIVFSQTRLTPMRTRIIRIAAGFLVLVATLFMWAFLTIRGLH